MAEASVFKMHDLYCMLNGNRVEDHRKIKQNIALFLLSQNTRQLRSIISSVPDDLLSTYEIHHSKKHSLPKKKCRWKGCIRSTRNSCAACNHKGGPLYLCGEHLEEHKQLESGILNY